MARPRYNRPTDAELQILGVLWSRSGSTVREMYNALKSVRGSGYNSVLKLMQIMHDKGYVRRDDSVRPQIYYAVLTKAGTRKLLVKDLLDRAFAGDGLAMLQQLVGLRVELKSLLKSGSLP